MDETITTYQPDNSLRRGLPTVLKDILTELADSRWLISQLIRRDLVATYKQSLFGVLWAFIIPFAGVATILLLGSSGVLTIGELAAPYPIYAILGLAFWQLFATGLVASSNALVNAGPMLVKINFSKKSLVLAAVAQAIVPFLMQLILLLILSIWYGYVPELTLLLLPVLVIPIGLLTLGLGFMLSLLNGVLRDTGNAVAILLTFLLFATPVLYAKPAAGILARVSIVNPLYYLVAVPRDIILSGGFAGLRGFLVASVFAALTLSLCVVLFHLTETRVTERI